MSVSPITVSEAGALFAPWRDAPALVLAVSGGPDSMALLWLAARWRRGLQRRPALQVVTVDHGLRREAAAEARAVKQFATALGLGHRTRHWRGPKPVKGVQAAAREARYRLLFDAARAFGASHVVTAHTQDDQAETVLMRLCRGSGLTGLAAMSTQSSREGLGLARPLLTIPKSRLIATLAAAGVAYVTDPSNADATFARPRLRALLPALAVEGGDTATLARLASRMARADAALEVMVDDAMRSLAVDMFPATPDPSPPKTGGGECLRLDAPGIMAMPEDIRIRLLLRAVNAVGHEGPAELGKVETLSEALSVAWTAHKASRSAGKAVLLKRTLAGAVIVQTIRLLTIRSAPPRSS